MFSGTLDSVTICTPGRPLSRTESADPFASKIGGAPAWHDEASAPKGQLRCRNCNQTDRMLMVCQIYAPTDLPRSLYVFACNRRQCSLSSRGWIVIRNQAASKSSPASAAAMTSSMTSITSAAAPSISALSSSSSSTWSFLEEPGYADVGMDDLELLLNQRDQALKQQFVAGKTENEIISSVDQTKSNHGNNITIVAQEWRPCRRIVDVEDSWIGKSHPLTHHDRGTIDAVRAKTGAAASVREAAGGKLKVEDDDEDGDEDEDDDEDEDGDEVGGDSFHRGVASDAHIQKLLQGYLQDDPDDELAAMINHGGSKDRGSGGKTAPKSRNRHKDDENHRWMRKLARNSAHSKAELYFQRRTAAEPQQVIRYAYGGEPLWCTYPPPQGSPAPPTCRCGAQRRFELQLMPALLALRMTARSLNTSNEADATAGDADEDDENEMDSSLPTPLPLLIQELSCAAGEEESESGTEREIIAAATDDEGIDDTNLQACEYAKPSDSQIQELLRRLGDGVDFGVLAIWVCPHSCFGETEEFCVVQQPSDIVA